MYDTIFAESEKVMGEGLSIDAASLYRAFEQVRDGRKNKGKTYPLAFLLTLLLLAKLTGETKISGAVQWARERKRWLRQQLHWTKGFPTNSTYTYALARCSGQQIAEVIAQVIVKARAVERCGEEPSRLAAKQEEKELEHVAVDGKTLRGTLNHQKEMQPPVHLLNGYACQSGVVLTHRAVTTRENEISAAGAILHPALVKGRILSTDAMHTQKKWCSCVKTYGGQYLSIVKLNQPQMYQDLKDFFDDAEGDGGEWQHERSVQKGHGRLEIREIWTSTQMNEWFEQEWTGIAQVCAHTTMGERGRKRA